MAVTLPGTTIEVSSVTNGCSRKIFDGIFLTGGLTLSQVSIMTGLEPYIIQNWVKRGFVPSPEKRVYSKDRFARIIMINMLRESLQIDRICELISHINGVLSDDSDNLISDSELYHISVDMISELTADLNDKAVAAAAENAARDYKEPVPGAAKRLKLVLEVVANAHLSAEFRHKAEQKMLMISRNT